MYLARHPGLNCEVMIKLAHQSLPADAQLASRLHQEAEILASLNHPHLARVWDADLFEGRPFLVLERINGETMLQSLRHGRPKVQEVVRRLHQLLDAVAVVHNIGVLHLDLKPENVMLASPSHVKLIDFGAAGFACDPDESGEAVSSIGTPEYMAPEQRAGLCEAISEQTDIFGLGGVLYVQLFGEPPFAHGRALPTFEMSSSPIWNSSQATEPIPGHDDQSRTRDVPQVLVEICRRALDQRLEKRYRTLSEFDAALRRFTQIERTGGYRRLLGAATLAVGLMSLAWTLAGRMSELPTDRNNHVRAEVLDGGTWIPLEKAVPLRSGDGLRVRLANTGKGKPWLCLVDSDARPIPCVPLQEDGSGLMFPSRGSVLPISSHNGVGLLLAGYSVDGETPSPASVRQCLSGASPELPDQCDLIRFSRHDSITVPACSVDLSLSRGDNPCERLQVLKANLDSELGNYEAIVFRVTAESMKARNVSQDNVY